MRMLKTEVDIFWNCWDKDKSWEEKGIRLTLMAGSQPKVTFITDDKFGLINLIP